MIIHMSDNTFAKNLLYLRKKYMLSRRALAKLIGISPYLLEGIEKELEYPAIPMEAFRRLCEVFHLEPDIMIQKDLSTPDT